MHYVFRYRAGHETAEAFDVLPNLTEAVEAIAKNVAHIPDVILQPIKGLAGLADGVKTMEISGLPNKYGILATFTNFHIVPILKDMIDDIDAQTPAPMSAEPPHTEPVPAE